MSTHDDQLEETVTGEDSVRETSGGSTRESTEGSNSATDGGSIPDGEDGSIPDSEDGSVEEYQARISSLEADNERLRREYASTLRSQHRRAALALAGCGLLALLGAAVLPAVRTVLLALGGTGVFGAVLTYFLTPERFVPENVGERVHDAHATNQTALIDDLGLQGDRVFVPTGGVDPVARLFVPQRRDYELPAEFDGLLVVSENEAERGVAFEPTGAHLYSAFQQSLVGDPAEQPAALATQLADALVETFELADGTSVDPDRSGGGVALAIDDPVYGDLDRPDHPILSLFATGLAVGLDRPVTATVEQHDRSDALVVVRWDPAGSKQAE